MCMLAECGSCSINKPMRVGSTEATQGYLKRVV